jgi:hypothetical protein
MIVRTVHDRIQLITQPDHAHLARRIMEQCVPLAARPRRDAILRAVGEHDNGWAEEDAAPTVHADTGRIADFVTVPLTVRHAVWPRGIARLAQDSWTAALVAQHALSVYDRFRPDPAWTRFFTDIESARSTMLRTSGLSLDELMADYPFVRLGDLISLVFCLGGTDAPRVGDCSVQLSGTRVIVTPEAFGGAEIPIEVDAREIRNQPFRSDRELHAALGAANSIRLSGVVTGNET